METRTPPHRHRTRLRRLTALVFATTLIAAGCINTEEEPDPDDVPGEDVSDPAEPDGQAPDPVDPDESDGDEDSDGDLVEDESEPEPESEDEAEDGPEAEPEDEATAPAEVEVTIDPHTGPAGETATITVTSTPNSPVTLTINGVGQVGGTTDANGVYTFDTTFNGEDGDEIPVEAEVGIGADTGSGSADYTIDNPETLGCTADDLIVTQQHESISAELIAANAFSAIVAAGVAACAQAGALGVAILDANGSGTIDDGDAFLIAPQPIDGDGVALGIDRGGEYFIGFFPPGTDASGFAGTPFDNPTETDRGWVFNSTSDQVIDIVERSPDMPEPARWNVDFGNPVMDPIP